MDQSQNRTKFSNASVLSDKDLKVWLQYLSDLPQNQRDVSNGPVSGPLEFTDMAIRSPGRSGCWCRILDETSYTYKVALDSSQQGPMTPAVQLSLAGVTHLFHLRAVLKDNSTTGVDCLSLNRGSSSPCSCHYLWYSALAPRALFYAVSSCVFPPALTMSR